MAIKTYQDFIKVASEMKDKYRDLSLFTFIRNKGSAIETTNAEGKKPPTTRYRQFNRKNEDSRIFYSEWLKTADRGGKGRDPGGSGVVFCLAARNRPVSLPFSRGAPREPAASD